MEIRVIKENEMDEVLQFARQVHEAGSEDPFAAELASWSAPWRQESLEHYLKLGWSFGAWEGEGLVGFCLAQPFLFFQGLTQSLWLEAVVSKDASVADKLLETCYRWARDKHLQQLVVHPDLQKYTNASQFEFIEKGHLMIPTAKLR